MPTDPQPHKRICRALLENVAASTRSSAACAVVCATHLYCVNPLRSEVQPPVQESTSTCDLNHAGESRPAALDPPTQLRLNLSEWEHLTAELSRSINAWKLTKNNEQSQQKVMSDCEKLEKPTSKEEEKKAQQDMNGDMPYLMSAQLSNIKKMILERGFHQRVGRPRTRKAARYLIDCLAYLIVSNATVTVTNSRRPHSADTTQPKTGRVR